MKPLIPAAAATLGTWAVIENTVLLRTVRYAVTLPGLPRLLQISDLHRRHFGHGQQRLIRRCAACRPELIAVTGDLVSRTVTDLSETEQLLRRLRALAPVIAVFGNHELDLPPAQEAELRALFKACDVQLLDNEIIRIGGIPFAGLTLSCAHYRGGGLFGLNGIRSCTADDIAGVLGHAPENTVLLAHNPLFFPAYAAWGARLTLSGHIHGGCVRLPVIGGVLSPERRFFPCYDKGRFRAGASEMIVSGGLGKLRLFNPPELCLITEGSA
jgi:predicted MPP superfamily phosphohydrolase